MSALAASAFVGMAAAAHAGPAWEFTSAGNDFTDNTWDFAAAFTVNATTTATGLGYYASPVNGQVASNPVVLYQCDDLACDGGATAIASATVTNIYPLLGHFRYVTIAPVTLNPGVGYEVAGVSFGDNYTWDDPGFATDPLVNYPLDQTRWQLDSSPDFLNYVNNNEIEADGFWGPNVFLGAPVFTGTPEPGAWALMLLGFGAIGAATRRARRATATA